MVKTPDWKLDKDRKSVTVTFPTDPPVALQLDVSSMDEILKNLGEFRELMSQKSRQNILLGKRSQRYRTRLGGLNRTLLWGIQFFTFAIHVLVGFTT